MLTFKSRRSLQDSRQLGAQTKENEYIKINLNMYQVAVLNSALSPLGLSMDLLEAVDKQRHFKDNLQQQNKVVE